MEELSKLNVGFVLRTVIGEKGCGNAQRLDFDCQVLYPQLGTLKGKGQPNVRVFATHTVVLARLSLVAGLASLVES